MLVVTRDGAYINTRAISMLKLADDGSVATLADGSEVALDDLPEQIAALEGTVLPAAEDFSKLIYYFDVHASEVDRYERHPVIGWRVIGLAPPEAITPQQDGYRFPDSYEGIRYPSGAVCVGPEELFPDTASWLERAKELRLEWLKQQGPKV